MRIPGCLASLCLIATAALTGCKDKDNDGGSQPPPAAETGDTETAAPPAEGECPKQAPEPWHHRYAMGSVPLARVSGLGEAPKCQIEFIASDVVKLEDTAGGKVPRLVAEGTFHGTCNGEKQDTAFESVKVAEVRIAPTAGVEVETLEAGATEALAIPVSDKSFVLTASPYDRCGFRLNPGGITNGRNAKWTMGEGCDKVLKSVALLEEDEPGAGFDRRSDEVYLQAVAPGRCELTADYFGVRETIEIEVE